MPVRCLAEKSTAQLIVFTGDPLHLAPFRNFAFSNDFRARQNDFRWEPSGEYSDCQISPGSVRETHTNPVIHSKAHRWKQLHVAWRGLLESSAYAIRHPVNRGTVMSDSAAAGNQIRGLRSSVKPGVRGTRLGNCDTAVQIPSAWQAAEEAP